MPSPSRRSPPRRPLHERSDSQSNELATPSLRLVEDEDTLTHARIPVLPTSPKQRIFPGGGAIVEDGGVEQGYRALEKAGVSPSYSFPDPLKIDPPRAKATKADELDHNKRVGAKKGKRPLRSGNGSLVDLQGSHATATLTPPAPRGVASGASPSSAPASVSAPDPDSPRTITRTSTRQHGDDDSPSSLASSRGVPATATAISTPSSTLAQTVTESTRRWYTTDKPAGTGIVLTQGGALHQHHHRAPRPSIRRITDDEFGPSDFPLPQNFTPTLVSNPSEVSLTSSASSETLPEQPERSTRRLSSGHRRFPVVPARLEVAKRAASAANTPIRPAFESLDGAATQAPSGASLRAAGSRRSVSVPTAPSAAAIQAAIDGGATIQYPVVRQPSRQPSWADTTISLPKRPARMRPHISSRHDPANHRLSTVPSEPEQPSPPRNGRHIRSMSSSMAAEASSGLSTSEILHSAQIDEGQLRPSAASKPTLRIVSDSAQPSSGRTSPWRHSFRFSSLPGWARSYYGRNSRLSGLAVPDSGSDTDESRAASIKSGSPEPHGFPTRLHIPRNRPHGQESGPDYRQPSPEITALPPRETVIEIRGSPRRMVSEPFTPRLQHDRRATHRSTFLAPPVHPSVETSLVTKRTIQVMLFCLGFIFPLAWMVAAFLPLPPRPAYSEEDPRSKEAVSVAAKTRAASPMAEARFENARWWRNVNRIMSMVGLLIIGAIIALAVVATR